MASEIEREIARLSNLKQNKSVDIESLAPLARINVTVREFKSNPLFTDKNEQKIAEERFRKYLSDNELESISDLDTLRSLTYNEIFEQRIQKELNALDKDGKYPPDKLIKSLVEVQEQKSRLKIRLGIDRKDDEKDELSALQLLQKRVHKHIQENKNEFTLWVPWTCEKCGFKDIESYLIYKRVKDFSKMKHPFFIGRYLANVEIIKDVKQKKITKEDAVRYLMCAGQGSHYKLPSEDKKWCVDYIDWLLENWTDIIDMLKKN